MIFDMIHEQKKHQQFLETLRLLLTRNCLTLTEYEKKVKDEFERFQYIIDLNQKILLKKGN